MSTEAATRGTRKGVPNYPLDFKRRLAEQACEPGVSVSKLARLNGINANMLFKWRRYYRAGKLGDGSTATLLPVVVPPRPDGRDAEVRPHGEIDIEYGVILVRIRGDVSTDALRTVLDRVLTAR